MKTRGVRGAITVAKNNSEEILEATKKLLNEIIIRNGIKKDDICFIIFSITSDLNAVFPARAAREIGLDMVPLLDVSQPEVDNSLNKCIRVLIVFNTEKNIEDIKHVYLEDAAKLRPDLMS
ncbi:MAG: chorismate mutase [Tepidanaerobacteraceae bacterium]|nr:chorismate mutase [Tepidanaerobacteraceae bacterium]